MYSPCLYMVCYTPSRGRSIGKRHTMYCHTRGAARYWAKHEVDRGAELVRIVTYKRASTEPVRITK